jgi:hypothetical protein
MHLRLVQAKSAPVCQNGGELQALGIVSALKRASVMDVGIRPVAVMGQSMPRFWVAMLLLILAVHLRLFPVPGLGVKDIVLPNDDLGVFPNSDLAASGALGDVGSQESRVCPYDSC